MFDRRQLLTLALVLVVACNLFAQPPSPPAGDGNARLDQLLARWEKETASVQSMVAELACSRKNNIFNRTEVLSGSAKFMRPDLARLDLKSRENPDRFERYVCTGSHIYVFRPEEKAIYVHPLPVKQGGQLPDDGALPFLFGMKAETAKKRYRLTIEKEDKYYTYIGVRPNYPRDQADFLYARLAILNDTFLPRQIYWVEPNKTEVTWDITRIQRDVPPLRQDFMKPDLPRGWEWKTQPQVPTPATNTSQPRVIRPQTDK